MSMSRSRSASVVVTSLRALGSDWAEKRTYLRIGKPCLPIHVIVFLTRRASNVLHRTVFIGHRAFFLEYRTLLLLNRAFFVRRPTSSLVYRWLVRCASLLFVGERTVFPPSRASFALARTSMSRPTTFSFCHRTGFILRLTLLRREAPFSVRPRTDVFGRRSLPGTRRDCTESHRTFFKRRRPFSFFPRPFRHTPRPVASLPTAFSSTPRRVSSPRRACSVIRTPVLSVQRAFSLGARRFTSSRRDVSSKQGPFSFVPAASLVESPDVVIGSGSFTLTSRAAVQSRTRTPSAFRSRRAGRRPRRTQSR